MTDIARERVPLITILTPVYNEQDNLPSFDRTVREVLLSRTDLTFEVLFIDDGSPDRSWEIIQEICRRDSRFQGIRLSRNFGSHIAISAGFDYAQGDAVATLACDLQDPPEVVVAFAEKWKKGAQIVWGHRRKREDRWWRTAASNLFFVLISRYAMPRGSKFTTGSFLLADRMVVECYRRFREQNRVTFALFAWTGFQQEVVEYDRRKRMAGESGWTFGRLIKAMYDTFIGFSTLPSRLTTIIGVGVSILNIPIAFYLLASWLTGNPVPGYTSLMLGLTFFFGIQFILMGLMGEYLHRTYAESVRRPLYFVSDQLGLTQFGDSKNA